MGGIVYLVRCNLIHGSKTQSGDDQEIIESAVPTLEALVEAAITYTKEKFR